MQRPREPEQGGARGGRVKKNLLMLGPPRSLLFVQQILKKNRPKWGRERKESIPPRTDLNADAGGIFFFSGWKRWKRAKKLKEKKKPKVNLDKGKMSVIIINNEIPSHPERTWQIERFGLGGIRSPVVANIIKLALTIYRTVNVRSRFWKEPSGVRNLLGFRLTNRPPRFHRETSTRGKGNDESVENRSSVAKYLRAQDTRLRNRGANGRCRVYRANICQRRKKKKETKKGVDKQASFFVGPSRCKYKGGIRRGSFSFRPQYHRNPSGGWTATIRPTRSSFRQTFEREKKKKKHIWTRERKEE